VHLGFVDRDRWRGDDGDSAVPPLVTSLTTVGAAPDPCRFELFEGDLDGSEDAVLGRGLTGEAEQLIAVGELVDEGDGGCTA
jgi:hypothetical protein